MTDRSWLWLLSVGLGVTGLGLAGLRESDGTRPYLGTGLALILASLAGAVLLALGGPS